MTSPFRPNDGELIELSLSEEGKKYPIPKDNIKVQYLYDGEGIPIDATLTMEPKKLPDDKEPPYQLEFREATTRDNYRLTLSDKKFDRKINFYKSLKDDI